MVFSMCRGSTTPGTVEVNAPTINFVVTFSGFTTDEFGAAQQAAYTASIQQAIAGILCMDAHLHLERRLWNPRLLTLGMRVPSAVPSTTVNVTYVLPADQSATAMVERCRRTLAGASGISVGTRVTFMASSSAASTRNMVQQFNASVLPSVGTIVQGALSAFGHAQNSGAQRVRSGTKVIHLVEPSPPASSPPSRRPPPPRYTASRQLPPSSRPPSPRPTTVSSRPPSPHLSQLMSRPPSPQRSSPRPPLRPRPPSPRPPSRLPLPSPHRSPNPPPQRAPGQTTGR